MRPLSLFTLAALIVAAGYLILLLCMNAWVVDLLRFIVPLV